MTLETTYTLAYRLPKPYFILLYQRTTEKPGEEKTGNNQQGNVNWLDVMRILTRTMQSVQYQSPSGIDNSLGCGQKQSAVDHRHSYFVESTQHETLETQHKYLRKDCKENNILKECYAAARLLQDVKESTPNFKSFKILKTEKSNI